MDYNSLSGNSSDIKNNNNNNVKSEKSILNEKVATVQYSSNSKGVLAQVRYIIKYFAINNAIRNCYIWDNFTHFLKYYITYFTHFL